MAVATIPEAIGGHVIAGLLGQDYLSTFDLDLDPTRHTLGLYDVSGCAGAFLPWTGRYTAIPASRPVRNILLLPVSVDGHPLQAELDSGASNSVVMAPGMLRLGLAPGGEAMLRGLGRGSVAAHTQHFAAVRIGDETLPGMTMLVAPIHGLRSVDMLLGADWLRTRRVWLSWATNQVFVAAQ
ncbi:MAG: retropepsin-like aspartic protease [Acetobacteraceae bacterium]